MSLFKIFDIAGSGLSAQSIRMNSTSSNLANAETVSSSIDQTYRARQPVFAAMVNQGIDQHYADHDTASVGVVVRGIVESNAPLRREYSPNHPMADEEGFISLPNVNPVEEMANLISASRTYQSNLEAVNTSKQLLLRTLRMGE